MYQLYKNGLEQVKPLNTQGLDSKRNGDEQWLIDINQAWSNMYDRQEEIRQIFKQKFEETTGVVCGKVYTSRMANTSTITMILPQDVSITSNQLKSFESYVTTHSDEYIVGWKVTNTKPKVWIKHYSD